MLGISSTSAIGKEAKLKGKELQKEQKHLAIVKDTLDRCKIVQEKLEAAAKAEPDLKGCEAVLCLEEFLPCRLWPEMDWVQCESCDIWFHQACALVITPEEKEELQNEMDWFCLQYRGEQPLVANDRSAWTPNTTTHMNMHSIY